MHGWIAYLRKSTDEKGKQVYSIEMQRDEIKTAADRAGIKIKKFVKENKSGTDSHRPVFLHMLQLIEEGKYEGIAAYSLDRLSRNLIDSGRIFELLIKQRKGGLFIAQYRNIDWHSYEGAMVFTAHMLGAIFEVLGTQMRTIDTLQHLRREGRQIGKLPYGYKKIWLDNKNKEYRIEIDEDEKEIIMEVYRLSLEEGWGRRRIASELGITDTLVRNILETDKYTGYTIVDGEIVELELPQLIPFDLFCQLHPAHILCSGKKPAKENGP